jgi:hypothetical protein
MNRFESRQYPYNKSDFAEKSVPESRGPGFFPFYTKKGQNANKENDRPGNLNHRST